MTTPTTTLATDTSDLWPIQMTAPQPGARLPSGVPWSTVLALAVPLGLTAGFWTVALRTSLGSIERTSSPFASWIRESILLLPLFVLAVMAALTLARRRFGTDISSLWGVGGVHLLVTGFGTAAGVVQMAASSAYDYHLQISELANMASMRDGCPVGCQSAVQRATLGLQEHSVLVGGLLLLVSNAVVMTWVAALRGWRLRLISPRTRRLGTAGLLDRMSLAETFLVASLAGSATIHAAVVPEHLAAWTAAGAFFVLLALVELGLAALAVGRRDRLLHLACLAASIGPLLLWLSSRTLGLPIGPLPGVPEPVGLADVAACALEVITALAALALLQAAGRTVPRGPAVPGARFALVLVMAVSALGLGGTELPWVTLAANGQNAMHHAPTGAGNKGPSNAPLNHR